jgi:hypothetical protein
MSFIKSLHGTFLLISLSCSLSLAPTTPSTVIMIDPAGDARHTGRTIGDNFERAITFQLATALEQKLRSMLPYTVIIARSPGEAVAPLQNATFANRLAVDLYLRVQAYHDPTEKHSIALYLLTSGEMPSKNLPPLRMTPLCQAHWAASRRSRTYADAMYGALHTQYAHQFQVSAPVSIPLLPLIGMQVPALCIEINCIAFADIPLYVEPLAAAIRMALAP